MKPLQVTIFSFTLKSLSKAYSRNRLNILLVNLIDSRMSGAVHLFLNYSLLFDSSLLSVVAMLSHVVGYTRTAEKSGCSKNPRIPSIPWRIFKAKRRQKLSSQWTHLSGMLFNHACFGVCFGVWAASKKLQPGLGFLKNCREVVAFYNGERR